MKKTQMRILEEEVERAAENLLNVMQETLNQQGVKKPHENFRSIIVNRANGKIKVIVAVETIPSSDA